MSLLCKSWLFLCFMTLCNGSNSTLKPYRLTKDPTCGIKRGCFHDCRDTGCSFLVTWSYRPEADVVEMSINFQLPEFYMYESRWFAIAFSSDMEMGDDSVIECNIDHTFYWLADVSHSYNKDNYNLKILPSSLGFSEVIGRVENNILTCNFTRDIKVFYEPRIFPLDTSWYMFVTSGPKKDGYKMKHENEPYISPVKLDLRTIVDVQSQEMSILMIKLHACFMIFAWVVLGSISVVIARYYKNVWMSTDTGTRKKTWLQIHRTMMAVCALIVIAGFVIIWVHLRGFAELSTAPFYQRAHPVLGIIIMGLTLINPIVAVLRPKTGTLARPVFRWAHTFIGTVVYILAILNIIIGVTLKKSPVPAIMIWILVGFALYQLFFEVFLEVHECHVVKSGNFADYVMKDLSTSTTSVTSTPESETSISSIPPGTFLKKSVLFLHTAIIVAIGSSLIVLIAIY